MVSPSSSLDPIHVHEPKHPPERPQRTTTFALPKRTETFAVVKRSLTEAQPLNHRIIDMDLKVEAFAAVGEFVGTFSFLFFAFAGTHVANSDRDGGDETSKLLYISLSFGMSLLVNVWAFYRISGGLFNPAVAVGLMATGQFPVIRGCIFIFVQLLAGIIAAFAIHGFLPGELAVSTKLHPEMSIPGGLFYEMFLTTILVFTILMLAVEKHRATFVAPVGIGLAIFVAHLGGVKYTGASLNPARSFGPCVATADFPSYHWIYWLGPVFGGLLAGGFYRLMKMFEYEKLNPGQDDGWTPIGAGDTRYGSGPALEGGRETLPERT